VLGILQLSSTFNYLAVNIMENNNPEENHLRFLSETEILLQEGKMPEALSLAEARLISFPLDVNARVVAANALINMGRIEEARNILHEVEEIILGLSMVYIQMGDIYGKNGLYQDAVVCYEKFISFNPNSDKAKEVVDKIFLLEQEEPLATEIDETEDHETLPKPDFHTVTLAGLYIKQGHFKMAAEVLEKILKYDPDNDLVRAKLDTVKTAIALKSSARGDVVLSAPDTNHLAETLARWLENIDRLKKNATK
jgi:tetratricopeptide (TPR) repeat protein